MLHSLHSCKCTERPAPLCVEEHKEPQASPCHAHMSRSTPQVGKGHPVIECRYIFCLLHTGRVKQVVLHHRQQSAEHVASASACQQQLRRLHSCATVTSNANAMAAPRIMMPEGLVLHAHTFQQVPADVGAREATPRAACRHCVCSFSASWQRAAACNSTHVLQTHHSHNAHPHGCATLRTGLRACK